MNKKNILKNKKIGVLCSTLLMIGLGSYSTSSRADISIVCRADSAAAAISRGVTTLGSSSSTQSGNCGSGKNVHQFIGNAKQEIEVFKGDVKASSDIIVRAIEINTANEIKAMAEGDAQLIKALTNITNTDIKDTLTREKKMLDMKMNYVSEIENVKVKASKAVMDTNDTAEEVEFILQQLKDFKEKAEEDGVNVHSQSVIEFMKEKYDSNNFIMPIRTKSATAVSVKNELCPEYDPVKHLNGELPPNCFSGLYTRPGEKLEKYFKECSRLKSTAMASIKKNSAKVVANSAKRKSQSNYIKKSSSQNSSEMAVAKITTQKETSCTLEEFEFNICGKDENGEQLTKEKYLEKVVNLEIIPNGNTSASNALNPPVIGSVDGDIGDITDDELAAIIKTGASVKTVTDENGNNTNVQAETVSANTPPLVNTYRTSTQYLASVDFVNNIVNKEAVSGINKTRSSNSSNALFESRFLSRNASLSLAENSLRKSLEIRSGLKLTEELKKGEDSLRENEVIREDVNGAGSLDLIMYLVDSDYNRLKTDASNVLKAGGVGQLETAPDKVDDWQVEALIKSNQLALMQFEQNERMELLLASLLANTVNSEKNVEYINSLNLQ